VLGALKSLGHDVYEITEEITNKKIEPARRLKLLDEALKSYSADLIFSMNYYPVISEICRIYGILYCSLIVDAPIFELYSHTVTNSCNRIFTFDGAMINENPALKNANIVSIPLCTDFEAFDKVCREADSNMRKKFSADISFVGTLYSDKCLYNKLEDIPDYVRGFVDGIVEAQLKVYGYNFIKQAVTDEIVDYFVKQPQLYHFPEKSDKDYTAVVAHEIIGMKVSEQERIRLLTALSDKYSVNIYTGSDTSCMPDIHNCGFAKTYSEMPLIFRESRINLNITSKTIQTGLPLRIFDVLACGGFLITNYQEQLSETFEIGRDLEIYSSEEELIEKVGFYLKNDDLRNKIARSGYEKVKANHTYNIRIKQILDACCL